MGKECLLLSLWAPRAPCGNAEGTPAMIFAGWRELVFYTQKKSFLSSFSALCTILQCLVN